MGELSVAELLLGLARQDALAYTKLASDPEIKDPLVGFHAQQTVEKAIKAVLSHANVPFRRTHDIAELLDLLADSGHPGPPHADRLDEFTPFAVELRYGLVQPSGLDRKAVGVVLRDVIDWADSALRRP